MPNLGPIPWWIALPAAAIVQFWAYAILKIGGRPTPEPIGSRPPGCSMCETPEDAGDLMTEEDRAEHYRLQPLPPEFLIRQQIDHILAKSGAETL